MAATRQPSLSIKPVAPSASPPATTCPTPLSLTTKEWVVPPRPKPGRRPATDTPPTKRKAQNRAAQRAFRERRAARVGELEDQIKQIEDENEREQDGLRAEIDRLQKEVEQYRTDLSLWVGKCRGLEKQLVEARAMTGSKSSSSEAVPLQQRPYQRRDLTSQQTAPASIGCGNCSLDTNCRCLNEAFDVMAATAEQAPTVPQEKRSHSPNRAYSDKRIKTEQVESLEIDFTMAFSSRSQPKAGETERLSPSSATADPCGFCQNGTPCICAEMAAEAQRQQDTLPSQSVLSNNRASRTASSMSQFTPPPSEGDVSAPLSTPCSATPCVAGPGTCAQCRSDPNSTLFCKSLAAVRARDHIQASSRSELASLSSAHAHGPQSSKLQNKIETDNDNQSQCQGHDFQRQPPAATTAASAPTSNVITLSCADAYTTLSRHPAYSRAGAEMASWLPKLHAVETTTVTFTTDSSGKATGDAIEPEIGGGVGTSRPVGVEGRPAMEIDAANVMAVLKEFDRRFGEGR